MRVMIVEDDPTTGALLLQLVRRLWPQAEIAHFSDGTSALAHWREAGADLVLLDWGLPGVSGIAVLEQIRRAAQRVPCVIVSGRADREVVMDARKYHVDAYFVKPFSARQIMARLPQLVRDTEDDPKSMPRFEKITEFIDAELNGGEISMPIDADLVAQLEQLRALDTTEKARLLRRCQLEPALVARLLGIANSSPYNSGIQIVETFEAALNRVGIDALLNLATELSLHPGSQLQDPFLITQDQTLRRESLALSDSLNQLARHADFDLSACRTAAMLWRCGEFVLLQLMQRWIEHQHVLESADGERLLRERASAAGDRMRLHWGIPNVIRMRAGAVDLLPAGTVKTDAIAMRIAGLLLKTERDPARDPELRRLSSRLGVPEAHWDDYPPAPDPESVPTG